MNKTPHPTTARSCYGSDGVAGPWGASAAGRRGNRHELQTDRGASSDKVGRGEHYPPF